MQNDINNLFYEYHDDDEVNGNYYYTKYTKWFPASVKPVHVGWYMTDDPVTKEESSYLWWWDGVQWTNKLHDNDFMLPSPCVSQNRKWRGLCVPLKNIIN